MTGRRTWQTMLWVGVIITAVAAKSPGETSTPATAPAILRQAYVDVIDAEVAREDNRVADALAAYRAALGLYGRLQAEYPGWQGEAISYRVVACNDAIAGLESRNVTNTTTTVASVGVDETNTVARMERLVRELATARATLLAEQEAQAGRSDATQLDQELERVRAERDQAVKANQSLLRRVDKLEARLSRRDPSLLTNTTGKAVSGTVKNEARRLMEAGDSLGAMKLLREAGSLLPDDTDLTVLLGVAACRAEKYDDAVSCLKPFDVRGGTNAPALLTLGTAYMGLGRVGDARVMTEKALKADPNSADANYNMAQILLAVNPPEPFLAQKCYKRAMALGLLADRDLENSLRIAEIMSRIKKRTK